MLKLITTTALAGVALVTGAQAIANDAAVAAPASITVSDGLVVTGQPGSVMRSIVVPISDLNLRQDPDVRVASNRLVKAARKVCGYNIGYGLRPPIDYRDCYDDAYGSANSDLNDAVATARRAG